MKQRTFLLLLIAALLLQGCATLERLVGQSATLGPANGSLVIVGGGVIMEAAGSLVGGIGVSGAPGGDMDDLCAFAGIAAIEDELEF